MRVKPFRMMLPASTVYTWESECISIRCELCKRIIFDTSVHSVEQLYNNFDEHIRLYHDDEFVDAR